MLLFVYVVIAIVLLSIYNGVSYYVIDFWKNYLVLKKMGVKIPIRPIVVYLFSAFIMYNLFYLLVVIYTFLSLE
jgi:hypothetical protein